MLLTLIVVLSLTPPSYGKSGEAQVTAVAGQTVTLSAGGSEGLAPGSVIDVVRKGGPVIHPLTHELLGAPTVPVCKVVVDQVSPYSATGRVVGEVTRPRTGDLALLAPYPPPTSRLPKSADPGELPEASGRETTAGQAAHPPTVIRDRAKQSARSLPPIPDSPEFSSEAERAQFISALRATYEFAKSARDVKSMRNISQRLVAAERSLAAQNRRIEELNSSLGTDVAQLREDVTGVKEEISLLQKKVEDLRQSVSGTGTTIRSRDLETFLSEKSLPVQQETTATGLPVGRQGRSLVEHRAPVHKAAPRPGLPSPSDPWYLHWVTWTIALAATVGTAALLVLRWLLRRRAGGGHGVEEESGLQEETPSPAEEIISPRKKRRVDFSAKEGDHGQPDQGQHADSQN